MFKKILIANRGEIACRVIHSCRELDIIPVAIFSEPDKDGLHVRSAGEAYRLEGQPTRVYLDIPQILDIARKAGVDAIHPGYGFLSENSSFARACAEAGIVFIGPDANVIERMGSKVESRRAMREAGVPVVPGTTDPVTEPDEVKRLAAEFGYPIAIKASAGGGGRGLRVVRRDEDVEAALAGAKREGESYFGSGEVYVEKYLDRPRHIEVQVIGDKHGNVIHLFERDCSTQRRHQKLIEETPAANLDAKLKARLLESAASGARALKYSSAGTMEFLVAGDQFYFLEMNTRVQVEHPISEMTTGVDIVREQIKVAAGEILSIAQDDVVQNGHAIEFRINAENPDKNFLPNPGTLTEYKEPHMPWTRIDSACYPGYTVLPLYDSLLAKLIVWGRTREDAISRSRLALRDFIVKGVATTIPFHQAMLVDEQFNLGNTYTAYVEAEFMKTWAEKKAAIAGGGADAALNGDGGKELQPSGNGKGTHAIERGDSKNFEVEVNQRVYRVAVTELRDPVTDAVKETVSRQSSASKAAPARARSSSRQVGKPGGQSPGEVRATMHGLVKEILVGEGVKVASGQKLIVFEAMKMESDIVAGKDGTITSVKVKAGETVDDNSLLLTIGD